MTQSLMTFGLGTRACPGRYQAHLVFRMVFAALVLNFDIASNSEETNDVTMAMRDAFVSISLMVSCSPTEWVHESAHVLITFPTSGSSPRLARMQVNLCTSTLILSCHYQSTFYCPPLQVAFVNTRAVVHSAHNHSLNQRLSDVSCPVPPRHHPVVLRKCIELNESLRIVFLSTQ